MSDIVMQSYRAQISKLQEHSEMLTNRCQEINDRWAAENQRLAADRDQISLTLDVAKADRDKWFNRAEALEVTLQGIAKLGGLTLLGGRGMESDRAYEIGAHNAFCQAAEMASAALERPGNDNAR